ncbi:leucine-rich repeat protein [Candidatus Enterococcus ferrettii]|uniref:Uncharacterized protein n=1 Tax=Candidatus Enterococcus ferrettii TaxID=2815324 RepID=A0ABV0EXL6_9ENTE|nr:leucine-rich repeat protein [Enterococcus sp. 665A]MBO1339362.1 leucine-rich repeat protein [Enterococcus sp. 665A]
MKKRFKWTVFLVISIIAIFTLSSEVEAATDDMYRLYNPNSGEHFYTKNGAERDMLKKVGWKDEGIGWYAPTKGDPVYRLYNPNAGDHHYTLNGNEKDMLVKVGWRYEGVGWFSDTKKTIKLYRAYNPNAKAGSHNYTVNGAEQDMLIRAGWKDEGLAWYGTHRGSGDEKPTATVKKTDLQNLYNKYKGTSKGTYTSATWNAFQSALKSAKSTIDNKQATQKQVDDAKSALQKAFSNLKETAKPEIQKFTVTVKYVDTENREIQKSLVTQVEKGNSYTAAAPEIEGYFVLESASQTISNVNKNSTIIFVYEKQYIPIPNYEITIKYQDLDGNDIQNITTEFPKEGSNFTATAPNIDGYDITGDRQLVISNVKQNQTIVFRYTENYLSYSFEGDVATVTGFTAGSKHSEVIIPSKTERDGRTYSVEHVGNDAFNEIELDKVVFSEGLVSIGDRAFRACRNLRSVKFPASLETIGEWSFTDDYISEVTIPEGVISIGDGAFDYNSITSLELPDTVTSMGEFAFGKNLITELKIPKDIKVIEQGAFYANSIAKLELPEGLLSIEDGAFSDNHLEEISLPSTLTFLGDQAFIENKLTALIIPDKIETVGWHAFSDNLLTEVVLSSQLTSIGDYAFENNQLTTVKIPGKVTSIGQYAFSQNKLETVLFSPSVSFIGYGAFEKNHLSEVSIPNPLVEVNFNSFDENVLVKIGN